MLVAPAGGQLADHVRAVDVAEGLARVVLHQDAAEIGIADQRSSVVVQSFHALAGHSVSALPVDSLYVILCLTAKIVPCGYSGQLHAHEGNESLCKSDPQPDILQNDCTAEVDASSCR